MPFKNTYSTFDDVECGLVSVHDGFVLPLHLQKGIVDVEVINHIGHYTLHQTYVNLTDDTLEALYILPIQEGGAVHFFTAESDGKVIESVVKAKDEGQESANMDEDDLAMGDDRTSFLLSEFKPDLYQLALGELAPNCVVSIQLKYLCELPFENNAIKLSIPTTVAPQYSKPSQDCPEKTAADQLVDLDKELNIDVNIKVRQNVAFKTESDPHEVIFVDGQSADDDGFYNSTGSLTLQRTTFEEEQLLYINTLSGKSFGARILIEETTKGEVAAMVTMVPEFPAVDFQAEMIFLVDRSGSMQGRSIEKAREALHIFLASLPSDCKFNICSFNASFDFLFDSPRPYNDQNLDDARKYTDNMVAGGGTRVFEPLETIFKQEVGDGCKRQIFVLTDGHVSLPRESVDMVAKYTKEGRVFSLGIGEGSSRELVNGLARAGNGSALFVTLAEDLKDKVLELLGSSLLSGLTNITFDWLSDMKPQKSILTFLRSGDPEVGTIMKLEESSAPKPIPHVFSSRLSVVYQSLKVGNLPAGLRISGTGPEGDVMLVVNVDPTKTMKSELLHKLMARRMVKMLEEDDELELDEHVQTRMTSLGTNYNITNKYCTYVSSGQFGTKKAKSVGSADVDALQGNAFVSAPTGIVRSSSPPAGGKKGKKKKTMSKIFSGGAMSGGAMSGGAMSGGGMSGEASAKQQVSNTRMAKSKMMKGMGSSRQAYVSKSMHQPSFNSPPPPLAGAPMRERGIMEQMSMQQQSASSPPLPLGTDASANMQAQKSLASKGQMRDEMLLGFTVLQKTDGSFSYGAAFAQELNIHQSDITAGAEQLGTSEELLMTIIVLIYLRSVMASRRSSWERMATKADGYIAANISETDLPNLEAECEKFVDEFIHQSRSKVLFKGYKKKGKR